jgi:hypothetical protein
MALAGLTLSIVCLLFPSISLRDISKHSDRVAALAEKLSVDKEVLENKVSAMEKQRGAITESCG